MDIKNEQGEATTEQKTEELSKAEARAKRKEAKKNKKGNKDVKGNEQKPIVKPDNDKKVNATSQKPIENKKKDTEIIQKNIENIKKSKNEAVTDNNVNIKVETKVNNTNELSKSELRAQRKAIQEAQRLAKANAKTEQNEKRSDEKPTDKQEGGESKAELRAKRRAIQESQRLAKEQAKNEKVKEQAQNKIEKPKEIKLKKVVHVSETVTSVPGSNAHNKLQLFHHLCFQQNLVCSKDLYFCLHSSIIRLGAQYMSHTVLGSNARCLALLSAVKQLVTDYRTPPNEEFCRSLESNLQLSTNYLQMCRPFAVSMTNALRHIKLRLTKIGRTDRKILTDEEKKELLLEGINTYIRDEIGMADKAISLFVQGKIVNGDVILIYGCSSIINKILLDAHNKGNGKSFKVIVVDSRPLLEGREMLRKLVNAGINCSYVLINAVSYIMGKATKVLLGAHSLLANGYVMSRTGTAQIALIAKAYNKPVLVCCETYKFCERVQTDSIVHNEIGDPEKIIQMSCEEEESALKDWKNSKYVTPLNLMYDVTPPDLVTAVVTELAILPCTSVPVILRIKPTEIAV